MGFSDKLKSASTDMVSQAQEKVIDTISAAEQDRERKQALKQGERDLKRTFNATKNMGDIAIDSENRLFKVKHASANIKKKSGMMAKTLKATAALYTLGASLAIEQAMKPSDKVFSFDELRSFELLEDDEQVVSGGVGMALVGGAFFGAGGAMAGAMAGSRQTKKTVVNLVLKINLTDVDFPCVMITYLNKETKVSSNDYRKALSGIQETISCLELIIDQVSSASVSAIRVDQQQSAQTVSDTADAIIKLKQLLDMNVITQAEFESKKAQLLNG